MLEVRVRREVRRCAVLLAGEAGFFWFMESLQFGCLWRWFLSLAEHALAPSLPLTLSLPHPPFPFPQLCLPLTY